MGATINRMRYYFPSDYDFVPKTFLIPEEVKSLDKHMAKMHKRHTFILKPSSGCQGNGIFLIKK